VGPSGDRDHQNLPLPSEGCQYPSGPGTIVKLGVDFGTTRTVVACADRGNYPVLGFLDEAGDSRDWFPSVIAERRGELRFGFEALAMASDESTVVRSFKRLLSDPRAVPGSSARIGSLTLPLGDLVTRFLEAVRDAILQRSNLAPEIREGGADGVRSVVAVPANAHAAARFVTLDAFRRAGFAPSALVNEPSAAGFEYTHRHRDTLTQRREHVVVYDLGGGTFDASLVRMRERRHEVLATAGVSRLGGDDFDEALLELVLDRAKLPAGSISPRALGRLVDQCRDAKERLHPTSRKLTIDLEGALGKMAPAPEAVIAVADFYDVCAPLVDRSIEAMIPVMARLDGASNDAGGTPEDIAGIYVVGGGSELPIVSRALRKRFGRRVHRSPYPSAAIAIGLAIACDETAGFELSDRYARTFGVFREGAAGSAITFDPIFTSETLLPARAAERVQCRRDYRAVHNVGHFRFFECSAVGADGRPRGDMVMSGDVLFPFDPSLGEGSTDIAAVPVHRMDDLGPRIEEEYALDEDGMVAVTIRNLDSGYQRVFRVGA
jgi:molecular chaperone DnaK (HSP70)